MDSKYSSKREKAQQQYVSSTNLSEPVPTAPQEAAIPKTNLSEDMPPSYRESQQQPFVSQPLPYPHQNQQFPPQQPFYQQQHTFPQPQLYPQAPIQQIKQINLNKFPMNITCPACKKDIITSVRMETSEIAHVIAEVLCIMCCCPCALVPYCIDSFKSAIHSCPDCRAYIGTYDPQTSICRVGKRN